MADNQDNEDNADTDPVTEALEAWLQTGSDVLEAKTEFHAAIAAVDSDSELVQCQLCALLPKEYYAVYMEKMTELHSHLVDAIDYEYFIAAQTKH